VGRLLQAMNPESGNVSYSYDGLSNVLTRTDNRGIQTAFNYDALSRILSKSYSDGTPAVAYSYDPAVANGKGQLGSVANGYSTTNYTGFDALGNVLASNQMTARAIRLVTPTIWRAR
jgi:YD repeat-containing protein